LAPAWLQNVAHVNPLSYVIKTMRALFAGNLADPVVMQGFAVIVPLTLLALWWAARSYRNAIS
jgi:ABC-2 type transport system permease protein